MTYVRAMVLVIVSVNLRDIIDVQRQALRCISCGQAWALHAYQLQTEAYMDS